MSCRGEIAQCCRNVTAREWQWICTRGPEIVCVAEEGKVVAERGIENGKLTGRVSGNGKSSSSRNPEATRTKANTSAAGPQNQLEVIEAS